MAAFIEGVLRAWPDQRILVVTHVRELIAQNFAELIGLWRDAPAGIYSAGLGRRDLGARILFAGIQSIHRRAYDVQQCDLVLIDEAHLIPGASDTMYRRFLDTLARINPQLKVIGFTATPYRLDSGMLHEGKGALFTDIAYEVSVRAADRRRLPLPAGQQGGRDQARRARASAAAAASSSPASCRRRSTCPRSPRRRSTRWCGSGATGAAGSPSAPASSMPPMSPRRSAPAASRAATIFGDTPKPERDRIIAAFKRGEIRALASMGVLTTGFNAPAVDLIAMLRPTKSTGLYVQMAGRGTRLAPGKEDCLVLDFAGNVARHGPIDAVKPKRPGSRRGRGAGQGLPGLPEHPRHRGPGLPRLRPRLPAAEGPGRARRPRRWRSSPPASRSG